MIKINLLNINDMNKEDEYPDYFGPGRETLLIIGNGFDLDLGLHTSYSDFVKSDRWPFHCRLPFSSRLGSYLRRKSHNEWFDLESSMAQFSSRKRLANILSIRKKVFHKKVQEDDRLIVSRLSDFIADAEKGEINADSKAAIILKKSCDSMVPATIYSFNYKDLEMIAKRLNISKCYPNYVHGTLKGNDIILGFSDSDNIVPELSFMCKCRREKYSSTSLFKDISTFTNIVFFGLSLGEIDSVYFKDFFCGVCHGQYKDKYIWVITKDEESRQNILDNVKKMTGNNFDLYNQSYFKVIKTNDTSDEIEFKKLYRVLAPKLGEDYYIDVDSD